MAEIVRSIFPDTLLYVVIRNTELMKNIFYSMFDTVMESVGEDAKSLFDVNIAVVGPTGVGKTSTCNALLGTNWAIGHTRATTRDIQKKQLILNENGEDIETNIYLTDFPGLGESLDQDKIYLPLYKEHLGNYDAIIWILSANERQIAFVQHYCNELMSEVQDFENKIIIGLNKVDLVEPMEWGRKEPNFPSPKQLENIEARANDVLTRFSEPLSKCKLQEVQIIPYTAKHNWRIWKLFEALNKRTRGGKKMSLMRFARPQKWTPDSKSDT